MPCLMITNENYDLLHAIQRNNSLRSLLKWTCVMPKYEAMTPNGTFSKMTGRAFNNACNRSFALPFMTESFVS